MIPALSDGSFYPVTGVEALDIFEESLEAALLLALEAPRLASILWTLPIAWYWNEQGHLGLMWGTTSHRAVVSVGDEFVARQLHSLLTLWYQQNELRSPEGREELQVRLAEVDAAYAADLEFLRKVAELSNPPQ